MGNNNEKVESDDEDEQTTNWTEKKDNLLKKWMDRAQTNKEMCSNNCALFKIKHKRIKFPILILNGISAAGNYSAETLLQLDVIKKSLKWIKQKNTSTAS